MKKYHLAFGQYSDGIYLAPSGFEGFDIEEGAIVTTDADTFWAAPVKALL